MNSDVIANLITIYFLAQLIGGTFNACDVQEYKRIAVYNIIFGIICLPTTIAAIIFLAFIKVMKKVISANTKVVYKFKR